MELTDPSIITSSINGEVETTPNASANNRNGQENDLQQFIKFLRNKNDSSKSPGDSSTVDEFHEQPIETTIESIVDYKPDLTESSKIYVYSINELLDITKTIPKEFIEEKADSLPRKKFWRLYQKYPDNSNHKSNYRNSNNNSNNSKSRSYSNDTNSTDRKNNNNNNNNNNANNKSKNSKNNNNKKNANKSMTLTNDELEFDANFESSGNAIADFEAWKSQMKEMERQKKLGIVNHASSSSSFASGKANPGMNQNENSKNTSSKLANTQSSIISDFLNLSRNNVSSGPMNAGTILGNNQSSVSTPHESPETKQLGINPTANETAETANTNDKQNAVVQPADLSRSSSSRFTSFFSNASSSSSSKPLNTETNNDQRAKKQQPNQSVSNESPQNRNQGAGSSKLMGFFNAPAHISQTDVPVNSNNNTNGLASTQQQQQQQQQQHQQQHQQQLQIPPQQMQMHPQQMGMQPGNNTFFQNLLNKNKANETGKDSHDQQFGQLQMPPPGMGGHPMGHQMTGPPPGMNNNFNNANNDNNKSKDKRNKNDTQNNDMPLHGMPHPQMGMPPMPPHMMQGNFNMPPPGFSGFQGQGPSFPLAPVQRDDDKNDKNTTGKNGKSKNNGQQGPMQQQNFMPMMGPPPPGFMPMHGMPPNMQLPNGMMMPPFPPQQQQQKDGKDVKNIQGGPQSGFFPQQMPPHPNFPMNPNMMPPQNQMRMNNGPNQNKK